MDTTYENKHFIVIYEQNNIQGIDHIYEPSDLIIDHRIDIEEYCSRNPSKTILYIFEEADNQVDIIDNEKLAFITQCKDYGFTPSDYKRKIKTPSTTYLLVGFLPRNTKYKFKLYNTKNGRYIKTTAKFVVANMI